MKHIDNYFVLSFKDSDSDWVAIAILNHLYESNLKTFITNQFEDWGYDSDEDIAFVDRIVEQLRLNNSFENDEYDIHYKIENVVFYD